MVKKIFSEYEFSKENDECCSLACRRGLDDPLIVFVDGRSTLERSRWWRTMSLDHNCAKKRMQNSWIVIR